MDDMVTEQPANHAILRLHAHGNPSCQSISWHDTKLERSAVLNVHMFDTNHYNCRQRWEVTGMGLWFGMDRGGGHWRVCAHCISLPLSCHCIPR